MRKNSARQHMAGGGQCVNAWLSIPSSFSAEMMSHQGFDSVTIDLQHGPIDFQAAVPMLQAISTTAATPMVRVPWNEPAMIMKVLDAGAFGIICPMVNTRKEAETLVSYARYAPKGTRSFGPNRAPLYAGADYWQHANAEILVLAMVETVEAMKNLEGIMSVDGLDGVYVGPSDLSLSMGKQPTLAPSDPDVLKAIQRICDVAKANGKIPGIHCDGARTAMERFKAGYQFCTILSDARLMANAAAAAVKEVKGERPAAPVKSY